MERSRVSAAACPLPVNHPNITLPNSESRAVIPIPIMEEMVNAQATTLLAPSLSFFARAEANIDVVATARKFARYVTMSHRAAPGPRAASSSLEQN
eukprot:755433-Hanusia_phi.AAC.1